MKMNWRISWIRVGLFETKCLLILFSVGRLKIYNPFVNYVQSGPTMKNDGRDHLAMTNFGPGRLLACGGLGTDPHGSSCEMWALFV